jgi:hypothetical protein
MKLHPDEYRDLQNAVQRIHAIGETVTDEMLVQWKANRGMLSAAIVNNKKKREAWLKAARTAIGY